MFSKFLKPTVALSRLRRGLPSALLAPPREGPPPPARTVWGVPPNQYDIEIPKTLQLGVCKEYWELVPVIAVTVFSYLLVLLAFIYASRNKVDIVFSTHSRGNISRTMDLRNPSVHKVVTINQKCEPWPEMQIVLDKMVAAEKRLHSRALSCSNP